MKKQLLAAAAVATISASSLGIIGLASAATSTKTTSSASLVDKIATKFGLNKTDVQAVFDQNRSVHEAERLQAVTEKLADSVKAGTITQAQSDAITAKIKELQIKRDANRTKFEAMTKDERKAAMDAERTALKQWISNNKIPESFVRELLMGGHRGHGGHRSMGMHDDMMSGADSGPATN